MIRYLLLVYLFATTAFASDLDSVLGGFDEAPVDNPLEDVLGGFDNEEIATKEEFQPVKNKKYAIHGYSKIGATYNLRKHSPQSDSEDWKGLSRLRGELQLELDIYLPKKWRGFISGKGTYDLAYKLNGENRYTDDVMDEYESEFDLKDTYIMGSITDSLDLKFGRQIVPWGKSDNIRITDVLNPMDMREPGLTDIEDMRLPVTMTKLDYYFGKWNLSTMIIHEIRFNNRPVYGHDFFPSEKKLADEDEPANNIKNSEFALALNGTFSGWDMSIYAADIYDENYHKEENEKTELVHSRIKMLGTALNVAVGDWLIKNEIAHFTGIEHFNSSDEFSRSDLLIGFEYSGLTDTTISVELADRHTHGHKESLEKGPDFIREDEIQSAVRINRTFMHEKLDLTLLTLVYDWTGQDGAMSRFSAEYELSEALSLTGGVVAYKSGGDKFYKNVGDNDRIFTEVKYDF